jgi:DNA-binding LytR/AlgR family response regulator
VNDTPLHSTLRELRDFSRDARIWGALLLLGLVAGLVGPFGTFEAMPPLPRIAYWVAIICGTGIIGTFVAGWAERVFIRHLPRLAASTLAGALAGPPVAAFVALLNLGVFGTGVTAIALLPLALYCTLIAAAVTVLSALLTRMGPGDPVVPTAATPPPLLERLALPQRGRLLHIAVRDHYVDVTTDKGTSLVLMRLSDAIRESAPIAGLQVHRSHWVALEAVRRGLRRDGKPVLELTNDAIVPVSRTYLPAVRDAGLI